MCDAEGTNVDELSATVCMGLQNGGGTTGTNCLGSSSLLKIVWNALSEEIIVVIVTDDLSPTPQGLALQEIVTRHRCLTYAHFTYFSISFLLTLR